MSVEGPSGEWRPSSLPPARNPLLRDATSSVSTYCRICEAACGLIAELDDNGRLHRVRPNASHAHSRGFACNKPQAMVDLTYDPDRITTPMVRTGGPGAFSPVTWEEALDRCAAGLADVRDESGPAALAVLRGNPPFFDSGGVLWGRGFATALGIERTYTVNAEDAAARLTANEALYGAINRFPRPDLWHTDLALIIGGNPLHARSTRLSEPQTREAFDAIVARGGRVLVVDPRRTVTAERYEHISLRPGTDPWFLLGVCHVICAELSGAPDHGTPLAGWSEFAHLVAGLDLVECAAGCGVDPATLVDVGRAFLTASSAVTYGGTGTCAQRFGTLTNILLDTVLALTGNIDRVGGMLAGWAAIDLTGGRAAAPSGTRRTRAEGRPEVGGSLPSAGLAADILEPGDDRVRGLVIYGNNSVLSSGGGGERLEEALSRVDFAVGMDLYVNETNRFAHVLLPVTTMFERSDYPLTTADTQLRPSAYATAAVIEPRGEARDSWWIFDEISRRMGLGGSCPDPELAATAAARGARPTPVELIDRLLAQGPVDDLTFADLVDRHPNGVALRATLPPGRLTHDLPTPDGCVQLYSEQLRSEVGRLFAHAEPDAEWPLRLIGRREKGSQNTWMHNASRIYPDDYQFAALIHPDDAVACGVSDGEEVRLTSRVGSVVVPAAITEDIRPGVVSVPNGWGHRGGSWQRANAIGGVNTNDLVDPCDVEAVAGMSILNGVPIRMERAADS
ncbi:molybdopterin-containing oxidoreductase family protein [Nocardioides alkalitolerans]|uniref:molybdopterin-containing oxidoreductase family protein n=1 Tax=Nocardioides alkalitolerans TaxID=281714 RepID=UPI000A04C52C|nr:molybdopterin-dependent oxidoreductase [Nocardioides alkalitolerans]